MVHYNIVDGKERKPKEAKEELKLAEVKKK